MALAGIGFFSREVLWYLGAAVFVLVALLVGGARPAVEAVRRWLARARDTRRTNRSYSDLRRFVARLGEFVDLNRSERLEEIVNRRLIERVPAAQGRTLMAPQRIFHTMWYLLDQRTATTPKDITAALTYWDELYAVFNEFEREHVTPVFQNLPQDLRQALDESARRDLNAFRERFVRFCDDYQEYVTRFLTSLESVQPRVPHVERPKEV